MAVALFAISSLFFLRQKFSAAVNSMVVSCVFFIAGLVFPVVLKPAYIVWMRFAFILGWINTRVILVILFYLIFTPIGWVMKLLRIDLLERKNKEGTERISC